MIASAPGAIGAAEIVVLGGGFSRPESVHFEGDGTLIATDATTGYRRVSVGGELVEHGPPVPAGFLPNGIHPEPDGTVLVANLGDRGGVWRISDGRYAPVTAEAELPAVNFITRDPGGRLWATVSTRLEPRSRAYRPDSPDGAIYRLDPDPGHADRFRPVLVADGLRYPNEIAFSPDGASAYVNETTAFRTTFFNVGSDATLRGTDVSVDYRAGDFCDGITVDDDGSLWVTCIVSNRLYAVDRTRRPELVVDDGDPAHTARAVAAFRQRRMDRRWFDQRPPGAVIGNMTSVAFHPTSELVAFGCLVGDVVHSIQLRRAS